VSDFIWSSPLTELFHGVSKHIEDDPVSLVGTINTLASGIAERYCLDEDHLVLMLSIFRRIMGDNDVRLIDAILSGEVLRVFYDGGRVEAEYHEVQRGLQKDRERSRERNRRIMSLSFK